MWEIIISWASCILLFRLACGTSRLSLFKDRRLRLLTSRRRYFTKNSYERDMFSIKQNMADFMVAKP